MDDLTKLHDIINHIFKNLEEVREQDGFYFIETKEFVLILHQNDDLGWYVNSLTQKK